MLQLSRAREHVRRGGLRRAVKETTRYVDLYGVIFSGLMNHSGRKKRRRSHSVVAVDILPLLEEEAKERQREAGRETHSNQYTKAQLVENFPQAALSSDKATATPFAYGGFFCAMLFRLES